MSKVIGRERQIKQLQDVLKSKKSELVVVYGRRRVGKTFLIRETYKKHIVLEVSGIADGSYADQLTNFHNEIGRRSKIFIKRTTPTNWLEGFTLLGEYIDKLKSSKKKVIFIDEFPWMYTQRSNFVQMFGHFWNSYCTKRNDLVVVICGSAASFMVNKIINDRKSLHNRISVAMRLLPFDLYETMVFLKSKKVNLDKYSYLQLYMAIGGIPHYLEKIHQGDSVAVAIDRLCFQKDGVLTNEFNEIFSSLFDESENHTRIIESLANTQKGLNRSDITNKSKVSTGGTLTKVLSELQESGFIQSYQPYGNKVKEVLYRLSDEYSLFYLKFIKNHSGNSWQKLYTSRSYASWSGFAFENLCLKHFPQIMKGLGLSGIGAQCSSWKNKNAQIDLLIDRDDRAINLCEMKFSVNEFSISKSYAQNIKNKKTEFTKHISTPRKNIFVTFVTTYGVKDNQYSDELMDNQITMEHLFEKL